MISIPYVSLSGHSYDFSQNLKIQEQQPSLQDLIVSYVHVVNKEREKEGLSELRTVKPLFFAGVFFRGFAKISIRAGLIFALSHCGRFFPLIYLVSQNAL